MALNCILSRTFGGLSMAMRGTSVAAFHSGRPLARGEKKDRRTLLKTVPKKDEGIEGENLPAIELSSKKAYRLPDPDTPNELFNGIPFKEVPIIHIKVSKNNTLMTATDHEGRILQNWNCGHEGFKNCRKGTNVAAQATGIGMASKLLKRQIKTVRICVQGLGPGRMASVKGLIIGGLEIISITDRTPFIDYPPRPRAAKSI